MDQKGHTNPDSRPSSPSEQDNRPESQPQSMGPTELLQAEESQVSNQAFQSLVENPAVSSATHGHESSHPSTVPRPTISEMNSSRTGMFQGWIKPDADLRRVEQEYLHLNNKEVSPESMMDIPTTAQDVHRDNHFLFLAAKSMHEVEDQNSQSAKTIQRNSWSDLQWELVIVSLGEKIRDAQRGVCNVPMNSASQLPLPYQRFSGYRSRLHKVLEVLNTQKTCVVSLFNNENFGARLAWNPQFELNRKRLNHSLNTKRKVRTASQQQQPQAQQDQTAEDKQLEENAPAYVDQ